jgi:hypothetical protein
VEGPGSRHPQSYIISININIIISIIIIIIARWRYIVASGCALASGPVVGEKWRRREITGRGGGGTGESSNTAGGSTTHGED